MDAFSFDFGFPNGCQYQASLDTFNLHYPATVPDIPAWSYQEPGLYADASLNKVRAAYNWPKDDCPDGVDPVVPEKRPTEVRPSGKQTTCKVCGIVLSATEMRRHQRESHISASPLPDSKLKPTSNKRSKRWSQSSPAPVKSTSTAVSPQPPLIVSNERLNGPAHHTHGEKGCLGSNETVFDHAETTSHLFTFAPVSNRPDSSFEQPSVGSATAPAPDDRLVCRCTASARLTGVGKCTYCRKVEEVEWIFGVLAQKRERRRLAEQDQALHPDHIICGYCGNIRRGLEVDDEGSSDSQSSASDGEDDYDDLESRCECEDSYPLDLGPASQR